jgi:PAS domain S-box-containing protein
MNKSHPPCFGQGDVAAAIRVHDWAASPLGPIDAWPPALLHAVGLIMGLGFPSFIVWGPQRTLLYNEAYTSVLADKHPAALGRDFLDVWQEVRDDLAPLVHRALVDGETLFMEDLPLLVNRKGYAEQTWFTYTYGPIRSLDDGAVLGFTCTTVETTNAVLARTERDATERALRASESSAQDHAERVQLALSAGAIIGTWFWDLPTDRFTVDEAFARSFGLDPSLGRSGLSLAQVVATVHPDDQADLAIAIAKSIKNGGHYAHQYRVKRADGHYYWIEANGRVDLAEDGTGLRFPGVLIDVQERRAIEAERDQAIVKLRALNGELEQKVVAQSLARGRTWQLSPDLIGVLNADGHFESSNPAWQATLGWTQDEVAEMNLFDFIHPDDRSRTRHAWRDAVHSKRTALRFENRYRHKTDGWRWLSWVAVPDDGKLYCSARDITAEKTAAAELEQAQEQLRQAQKMEAVGQLTGGLAHDFNNLLAGISGSLELIAMRIKQGRINELDRYMTVAMSASKRAAALTHRLLAFSRRQTLAPQATDVNAMIGGMLDMIRRTTGPSVRVEATYLDGLWPTLVDQSQLENALLNLCINARDAMPNGGHITIETSNQTLDRAAARERDLASGDYLLMRVTDTGVGMPPDVIAKAFDPFFTTKPIGQGTGLGLSMIYGFAKQSGGQVRIDSRVGHGTVVQVYLPRHRGDVDRDDAPLAPTALLAGGAAGTVRVVDDEPSVRMLVTDVLKELGYTVVEAADAAGGLKVLQSDRRLDLIVTDVGLPGLMNGRQLADAARVTRPHLNVLFITGYAENALLKDGQLEPGMAVLTKPFAVDTLVASIRRLIAQRMPEPVAT